VEERVMNAPAIRRYLQPSPTLRWHPWAPLIAALIMLGFVFWAGAMWGFAAHQRAMASLNDSQAFADRIQIERETKRPGTAAYWQSRHFDEAVKRWVLESQASPSTWQSARNRFESIVFWKGALREIPVDQRRESIRSLAQFRLDHLAGNAPRWLGTATYCEDFPPPLTGEDLRERYRATAAAYSVALGRSVAPEELAPNVPGLRCEWRGPTKF
jgi:hypothetical protein